MVLWGHSEHQCSLDPQAGQGPGGEEHCFLVHLLTRLCALMASTLAVGSNAISQASLSATCKLWSVVIALSKVRFFSATSFREMFSSLN